MVSIIIPAFNAGKTLKKCVDSILIQTYQDFELILVNDGSQDQTGDICDAYLKNDRRVTVVHKSNGGVSSARNAGLELAKGDWVTFVDSDDWVAPSYLEHLINESVGVDLVVGFATFVNHPTANDIKIPSCVVDKSRYDVLFSDCYLSWRTSPWNKLYRIDIIRDNCIYFKSDLNIGEDAVFLYTYLLYSHKVKIVDNRNYYYLYDSEASLTKRLYSAKIELYTMNMVCESVEELITKCRISSLKALSELYWLESTYIHRVLNSLYYDESFNNRLEIIRALNYEKYCEYFLKRINSFYFKVIRILLINRCFVLYDLVRRIVRFHKKLLKK